MANTEELQVTAVGMPFGTTETATALLDGHGVVTGWSAPATRLLGFAAADVLGTPVGKLLAVAPDARGVAAALEWTRDEGSWAGLVPAVTREGRRVNLGVRINAVTDGEGTSRWVVSAVCTQGVPWWGASGPVIERMFALSPMGMAVLDSDLRYVWVNAATARASGVPADQWLGRSLAEMLPGVDIEAVEAELRAVLDTGVPLLGREYVNQPPWKAGQEQALLASVFRLDDAAGNPLGLCTMANDITDRYLAKRRLDLLDQAGERIGRTLDVAQTAQDLADVAVPEFADLVTVDLLDPVFRGEEPRSALDPRAGTAVLRRAGLRSVGDGPPATAVEVGQTAAHPATSPVARALHSGRPRLVARLDPHSGEGGAPGPEPIARMREAGFHSLMAVPLRARGSHLGVALFWRGPRPQPFQDTDLALATELTSRVAVAVDNARRFTREHNAALTLQRDLLPQGAPEQTAVEAASLYLPADARAGVGGDWFDVIPLSGARVGLVVGDVVGHGIHAAATMGRLRTAVQTLAGLDLAPDELLAQLDGLIGRLTESEDHGGAEAGVVGATCLYAVYDPVSRRCTLARAGHPPPLVAVPGGPVHVLELPSGPPLGLGNLPFESTELTLDEGSALVLYTNGLIAAPGLDADAGIERLCAALAGPDRSVKALRERVMETLPANPPDDDVALLLARTRALGAGQVASREIPRDPAAVSDARAWALATLGEWGLDELAFTAELVVSELVTNAVRYGSPPIRLRLIRERALICEVSDHSSTSPHLRRAGTTDEGGRGLFLVAHVVQDWGTRYTPEGKTVWAEQPFEPHPAALAAALGDGMAAG
ncbi:SpoIIE family protein phosphatase [Streptomyces sparsogenes]|uniref:SpoIIE family protein phosphatase n=1 Tax=Streptomyces sparsogenes TaxID=67365 RepID=UPI00340FE82E